MRAINLVPADSRPGRVNGGKSQGAVFGLFGVIALLFLGMAVLQLSKKKEAEANQQLSSVQQSTQAYSAIATQYSSFEQAASQATARISLVRGLAQARFDWAGSMRDMSRLVPTDTQIINLAASVSQDVAIGGGSGLRSSLDVPAISLDGCSTSQDSTANLINQLQAMRRVTNVTLESSETDTSSDVSAGDAANLPGQAVEPLDSIGQASTSDAAPDDSSGNGCSLAKPFYAFSLVVFFAPGNAQAAASASGSSGGSSTGTATAVSAESAGATTPAATTPAATTPAATTPTTSTTSGN